MAASNFLTLRSSLSKPSSMPFLFNPIKNFGQVSRGNQKVEERAPSTAEEFERVAEEKAREAAKQGIASQTTDKAFDAAEEATKDDSNAGSVKNKFKEHDSAGTDYRRTGK